MKTTELRSKSKEELALLLAQKRGRVNELRLLFSQRKVKNVKEMGQIKKDIARILTFLGQRSAEQ